MKINLYTYLLFIVLSFFGVGSFYAFDQKEDDRIAGSDDLIPALVLKELDIKIKRYQNTILDNCRRTALKAAETYIDSLVSEELKLQVGDTLRFPAKPLRPELREPIILNDSTVISPIIRE